MKTLKLLAAIAAVLCFYSTGLSQNYVGITPSNYAGVMGTDVNPASFVDGRFVVDVNLASANVGLWTNAGSFTTVDMPKWWVKSFKADSSGYDNPDNDWIQPDSSFVDRYITKNFSPTSVKTVGIYNNVQLDVLNFMFHINRKIAIGAAVKFRSITNVDDVDPKLAFLAENSLDYEQLWNQDINETLLNVNHMSWMEYGLIYSQVLKDDGEHFMKMGAKAKWLSGYTAAYLHTSNLSYNLSNSDSTNELVGDFSYGHSTGLLNGDSEAGKLPEVTSKFGLGLDLGFVYEWRPDWKDFKYDMDGETNIWRRDQDKYKIRVGASILDIGGMKFAKGGLSQDFSVNQTSGFFDLNTFNVGNGILGIDSVITDLVDNDPNWTSGGSDSDNTFFMQLPTAVSLQFDYHIYKWFYVNATGNINVQNRKNPHRVRTANQLSITPSFDHAWFGVHLPFMMNKYSGFKSGIGVRLGPLTIGVNDWNVLFASGKKIRGAQAYAGLRIPVLYGHPSDIDGDKVSDELDECEVVPGLWEFKGCPDSDHDGIKDIVLLGTNSYLDSQIQILINDGLANFTDETETYIPNYLQEDIWSSSVHIVDINDDSYKDLLLGRTGTYYLNDGSGIFSTSGAIPQLKWRDYEVVNIDSDIQSEIVFQNHQGGLGIMDFM